MKITKQLHCVIAMLMIISSAIAQHNNFPSVYKAGDQLYVHAKAGLTLRQTADAKGSALTVVPFGKAVKVLPFTTQTPFTNSGIEGVWVKVAYEKYEGYQFSGFLSRYQVGTHDQPDTYLQSLFKVKTKTDKQPDSRNYNMYVELYFANGIVFLWSAPEGGSDITITFPESLFTFQEAYLYAREMREDFFAEGKCTYTEGEMKCNGEYSALSIKHTEASDRFHPVKAIEVTFGDAD